MNKLAVLALVALGTIHCTGGRVTKDGQPVGNANVVVTWCEKGKPDSAKSWTTKTDAQGVWSFNPFDPNSAAINKALEVNTGKILIYVNPGNAPIGGSIYATFDHGYDETCNVKYNGENRDVPCKKYFLDFKNHTAQTNSLAIGQFTQGYCYAQD